APPQQSPEEIRAMEAEATFTVQQVAATAIMLYLCIPTKHHVTLPYTTLPSLAPAHDPLADVRAGFSDWRNVDIYCRGVTTPSKGNVLLHCTIDLTTRVRTTKEMGCSYWSSATEA
ncbi:hypothetical protein M440DRAFT_1331815, partial [Trichoderma longibrachiatum ATCC 18648]